MRRITRTMFAAGVLMMSAVACGSDGGQNATSEATDAPVTTATPETTAAPPETAAATTAPPTAAASDDAALPESLSIMAPADPGGGWDTTARTVQTVADPLIDGSVEVYNRPGAGGTVGLAEFVGKSGSGTDLLMMGSVMIGAIQTNASPVTLDDVTPIASLTTEYLAIAVKADSPYQSLKDLMNAFVADPTSVSWGGGSAGGNDHQLVALLAKSAGVDVSSVNYVAHSGGGELLATMLSGAVNAGVSGVSEFRDQVDAGELRFLAVSGAEAIAGIDAPTIVESGWDVTVSNWRGIVAAPELDDADRAALLAVVDAVVASDEWQAALEENGWTDFYQAGPKFAAFLDAEQDRIATTLKDIGLT